MSDALNSFQHRVQQIVTDAKLNPKQKNQFLALEAEASFYRAIPAWFGQQGNEEYQKRKGTHVLD